jgi:cell wall-associated NlpC family hydrolase
MFKKFKRTICVVTLAACLAGTSVFADEVDDITNQKTASEAELQDFQGQLTDVLQSLNEMEIKAADLTSQIETKETELEDAERREEEQTQAMYQRIQLSYERGINADIINAFMTSGSMADLLNQTSYIQSMYDYDRNQLQALADTKTQISTILADLNSEKDELEVASNELTEQQNKLFAMIDEKQGEIDDLEDQLAAATERALARNSQIVANQIATVAANSNGGTTAASNGSAAYAANVTPVSGDTSSVLAYATNFAGIPYVWGGSSLNGFDCSGLTQYVYAAFGVSLPRSSGAQGAVGNVVAVNSTSGAQPGDLVTGPGHVAIYVDPNTVFAATMPGDTVRYASLSASFPAGYTIHHLVG